MGRSLSTKLLGFFPVSGVACYLIFLTWRVGIWAIIKGWLDPKLAVRVSFTRTIDDLEEFIPRKAIPKDLDGDEAWKYEYVPPSSDENQRMKDTATRNALIAKRKEITENLGLATLTWASGRSRGDLFLTDMIRERRAELIIQLSQNYWDLDPYIRARSLYDRLGVIHRWSY